MHLLESPEKSLNFWEMLPTKISRTWKVLENEFGLVKFWKLKFRVMESPDSN